MGLKVEKPGLLTTVQDCGRRGHQKEGVVGSGAMDSLALRIGNLLVGNLENSASLELTVLGPTLTFTQTHLISLTGADFSARIDGMPVPPWRPVLVRQGATLTFGAAKAGARGYLSVAGGLLVPLVLGSAATYLKAGFGGWQGKALTAGAVLDVHPVLDRMLVFVRKMAQELGEKSFTFSPWTPASKLLPAYAANPTVRAVRGPEHEWFTQESRDAFWQTAFLVTPQSDRMGYQLQADALELQKPKELLSAAVTFGTVQVPASGQPIVLMADRQTTGGYPRIAQVITADFSLLAQVLPGQHIRFLEVSLEEAQFLYLKQERHLQALKQTLSLKFKA